MVLERADIKKLIQAVFWYAYAFMLLLADNSGKFSDKIRYFSKLGSDADLSADVLFR